MNAHVPAASPALLVMDFQAAIVARHDGHAAAQQAADAVRAAKSAQVPVFWVRVGFRPGHPEVHPRNRVFAAMAQAGQLVLDAEDSGFHPAVRPEPGDVVVTKKRVSAFAGSDLDVILRARGVDTLVLAGVSTSGVVLSTLRQAADLDYALVVLADACADADETAHRALLENIFPRQGDVTTVNGWAATIGSG